MQSNIGESIKDVFKKNKKRDDKYRAMALAGYSVAAAGIALGAAWVYGTTDAVGETVLNATSTTLAAAGIFAGTGAVAGAVACIKDYTVKKVVKQIEVASGKKITRKWGLKPYWQREVIAEESANPIEVTEASTKLKSKLQKYIDKGILDTTQWYRLVDTSKDLNRLVTPAEDEKTTQKSVEPELDENKRKSLEQFHLELSEQEIDDKSGQKIDGSFEYTLKGKSGDELVALRNVIYSTIEGAEAGQLALLKAAKQLSNGWYPLQFNIAQRDALGEIVENEELSDVTFETRSDLKEYCKELEDVINANNANQTAFGG